MEENYSVLTANDFIIHPTQVYYWQDMFKMEFGKRTQYRNSSFTYAITNQVFIFY